MSSTNAKRLKTPRAVGVHFEGDLRRALLDAAVGVLEERGAEHMSLREVARRLGVSHAAPAHHFGDKAGLLTAVAVEGFGLFAAHLVDAVSRAPGTPVEQLPALGRAYAEFAEHYPGHFEVMFRPGLIRTDDPDYVAASDAAFDLLRLHVDACQQAGWRPEADARALAAAAWSFAHGMAVLRVQGSLERHYPDATLGGVADLVKTFLGPPPPTGRRRTR